MFLFNLMHQTVFRPIFLVECLEIRRVTNSLENINSYNHPLL